MLIGSASKKNIRWLLEDLAFITGNEGGEISAFRLVLAGKTMLPWIHIPRNVASRSRILESQHKVSMRYLLWKHSGSIRCPVNESAENNSINKI